MNKTLMVCSAATLSLALASGAQAFSLFGIEFGKTSLDTFQSHAPDDTALYIEGRYDKAALGSLQNSQNIEAQLLLMQQMFSEFENEEVAPYLAALLAIFGDMATASQSGMQGVIDQYGLAKDGASALYLDGALPVLQMALAKDDTTFVDFLASVSADFDLETDTFKLGEADVSRWVSSDSETPVELLWTVQDNLFTLALSPTGASPERQQQLLALTPETSSLAASKNVKSLRKAYDFSEHLTGYVSFSQLGKSLLNNPDSRMSQDIALLFGSSQALQIGDQCQQEIQELIDLAPRFVFGSQSLSIDDNRMQFAFSGSLEIADQQWQQEFISLNGHLPDYVRKPGNSAVSFSYGFNGNQLAPLLTRIWNNISSGEYQCETLQSLQIMAQQANQQVAGALAGSAMLNGLKGLGMAIFDLQINDSVEVPEFDALITVHAENAMTFLNLARMAAPIPELQNIVEGKVTDISVPGGVTLKVLVEKDIIGIYRGEQAEAALAHERQQPLNADSLFGASINYQAFAPMAKALFDSPLALTDGDPNSCLNNQLSYGSLSDFDGYLTMNQAFDARGLSFSAEGDIRSVLPAQGFAPAGTYDVQFMDEYCDWLDSGEEIIAENGTGSYGYTDDSESCLVDRYNYSWRYVDQALNIEETSADFRDSCDQEWETDTEHSDSYRCLVTHYSDEGFDCLMSYEGELTLYRYTRR